MKGGRRGGIRSARNPDRWAVPPWPTHADIHTVAEHFGRFRPETDATTTELLTYYETYTAELQAAHDRNPNTLTSPMAQRWYHDYRNCLLRCIENYRQQHKDETNQSAATTSADDLPVSARVR